MIEYFLVYGGWVILLVGAIFDLIAAIGMNRFRNFFLRLHAATIGVIGGAFYPLLGVTLIALGSEFLGPARFFMAGASAVTAFLVLLLAPAGSHALARAAHRKGLVKPEPVIADHLQEDGGGE